MLDQENNFDLISLSILITRIMYGYHREKLHVNHFWELNAANILLRFLIKVTCMGILLFFFFFFFLILLFQLMLHSKFSTKLYFFQYI